MPFLLTYITFAPLILAAILLVFGRTDTPNGVERFKKSTLWMTTIISVIAIIAILGEYRIGEAGFQLVDQVNWIAGFQYKLGVDGISVLFVILTLILQPIVIGASWNIETRVKEYFVAFLVLETLMIGVFVALDMVLFYVFFEAALIPMFLIIGIWGGKNRIYASFKFFLYTLLGSLLMLVAMIYMIRVAGTSDVPTLMSFEFAHESFKFLGFTIVGGVQTLLFLAFFASFAVKMPMWPVHTWLPDAHVQAPTAGSVVLAAILLKMGGYGFVRFSLPMFPEAAVILQGFIFWLSAIAIVYTSLVAMVQEDMKKLIAYSSVAHMGYVTMGIFTLNQQGLDGAIYQMISHGFISGALFLCVGVIYDRMHTREISAFGGLVVRMPLYALIFMFFTMANVGLPGTSGFIGEFLTLAGTFQVSTWTAAFATTGVILSAAYALWLYRRVVFGDLIKESLKQIKDIDRREGLLFVPLIVGTLVMGVYPKVVLDYVSPAVAALVEELPQGGVTEIVQGEIVPIEQHEHGDEHKGDDHSGDDHSSDENSGH